MTARLQARWDRVARTGRVVDLHTDLLRYTTEVITAVVFGDSLPLRAPEQAALQQHLAQLLPVLNRQVQAPFPYWRFLALPADRAFTTAVAALRTVLAAGMAQGRARMAQDPTLAANPTTVFEAMLAARDAAGTAWSVAELLGNILTLLVAGEETTANTLAWMMHMIADLPAVQHTLQQEVDAVLGAAPLLQDVQAYERLRYLEAVAHETMRLKSVAPLLFFEPTQAVAPLTLVTASLCKACNLCHAGILPRWHAVRV